MYINPNQIVFVETVGTNSKVAQLIAQSAALTSSHLCDLDPARIPACRGQYWIHGHTHTRSDVCRTVTLVLICMLAKTFPCPVKDSK